MKLNFEKRLKEYLINLIIREGDEDAWEHLKTLNLDNDDLYTLILKSKFLDEAWEIMKQQSPSKKELVHLLKHSDKSVEATACLLQQLPLDNETLVEIVEYAYSDEAAKILLHQNPDLAQLETILEFTNLKNEVTELLLNQTLENEVLLKIIEHSESKIEAWEKLLQQKPTNEQLIQLIQFTDLEELAWQQLLKQNPTNEELMDLVNNYNETGRKRTEAATVILKQNPDIETLTHIIDNNILVEETWQHLQTKSPTSSDLEWLIWRANIKVNEASALSLKCNPNKEELLEIFESSDKKEETAALLVNMPLEISELVNIILYSNNKRAVELLSEKTQFDRSAVNEQELFQQIKAKLLKNPDLLNVNHWHDGETHCFGGWAIMLHKEAQKIEKQFSSEAAACLLLPHYTHLFFADKETVLAALKC